LREIKATPGPEATEAVGEENKEAGERTEEVFIDQKKKKG